MCTAMPGPQQQLCASQTTPVKQSSRAVRFLSKVLPSRKRCKNKLVPSSSSDTDESSWKSNRKTLVRSSGDQLVVFGRKEFVRSTPTELTVRRRCVPHHSENLLVTDHDCKTLFETEALLSCPSGEKKVYDDFGDRVCSMTRTAAPHGQERAWRVSRGKRSMNVTATTAPEHCVTLCASVSNKTTGMDETLILIGTLDQMAVIYHESDGACVEVASISEVTNGAFYVNVERGVDLAAVLSLCMCFEDFGTYKHRNSFSKSGRLPSVSE